MRNHVYRLLALVAVSFFPVILFAASFTPLGDLPGGIVSSIAWGISADGAVVVGDSASTSSSSEAFRWTSGSGMVGLGDLPGSLFSSHAYGVGGSPSSVVVAGFGVSTNGVEAFRWTSGGGMVGLGDLPGGSFGSVAYGISGDGLVLVGQGTSASGSEAMRWTSGTGMVGLGDLAGGSFNSMARGASADGAVIVGWGNTVNGQEAFLWNGTDGMQRLFDVLVARGATGLTGWKLNSAYGISADGKFVAGWGTNSLGQSEAFLANIAPVPVPPAVWLFGSALGLMGVMRRKISS
jgi:probable HAF family extracellular repeat protein